MKTISELNEKWWYRLLKVGVLCIFIFLIVLTAENKAENFSPQLKRNSELSNVTCLDGNKSVYAFNQLWGTFSLESLTTGQLDSKLIAALCGLKDPFGDDIPKGNQIFYYMTTEKADQYLENPDTVKAWEQLVAESYSVNEIETVVGSWYGVIARIFIEILALLLFVELARRVFYYIVLGSIRPKKKHESDTILP
jgi:hypothetical protein